jgi:transposase
MGEVSTIGIDIAKSVFQVHGVDTDGAVVIRKRRILPNHLYPIP